MHAPDAVYAESIAGQVIDRALQRGRLAHALMLHGGEADVLEAFARQVAARLLELPTDWASGNNGHADYITLRPSGKSRQIRIGADGSDGNSMRAFIRQLSQSPLSAPRKVAVVFEAERLNINSANAFLKTLEEPPLDTSIILLTSRPYSLLPTIRSRCLSFRIPTRVWESDDSLWVSWFATYRDWLAQLTSAGSDKSTAARLVMTVYALVARFANWSAAASSLAVEQLKSSGALENLDDEEVEAIKAGTSVGMRHRFFTAIENATCEHARKLNTDTPALATSVRELERAASLLRVNLNENAALELFLLTTLRAWSRREG